MSKYGPQSTFIVVGGCNVTGDIYDANITEEQIIEETHSFGDSWEEQSPVGIAKITLETGAGLYDDTATRQLEAFQETGTAIQLVALGVAGHAIAQPATMLNGTYVSKWTRSPKREGLTMGQATHTITGSRIPGIVLQSLTGVTGATGDTKTADLDALTYVPAVNIATSDTAEMITTEGPHGLAVGDAVFIAAHGGGYTVINPTHAASTIKVTIVDTTPSLSAGTLRIKGTIGGVPGSVEEITIAAAGTYTSVGSFTQVDRVNNYGVVTLGGAGNETILVEWTTGLEDIVAVTNLIEATIINNAANTTTAVLTVPSSTTFTITGPITVGGQGGTLKRVNLANAVADLHVTALTLSGRTNVAVLLEHSHDGVTWATAATFAVVIVAGTAERVSFTNLRRYRAMSFSYGGAGGSPTSTPFVVVERG
jgi:hypothetical protein